MKILFIHNRYQMAGGEDSAVESEAEILRERGHAAEILYFDNTGINSLLSKIESGIQSIYNWHSSEVVKKKIADFNPDVIHVHNLFFKASPSVLYAAAEKNIPIVVTIHNYRLLCANALFMRNKLPCELCAQKKFPISGIRYRCYRSSAVETSLVTAITGMHKIVGTWAKKVSKYIALTPFAKEKLLHSSLHLSSNQICVKPNFIADYGAGPSVRDDYFLFAGRLAEEKGAEVLLHAFAKLPHNQLILAGEGPEKERLQEEFKQHTNIVFAGKKNKQEIISLMKKSKALIFPSTWYEGLPFTIIEAFSTGTPVLASRLGAMETLINHGYNGLHFTAGSSTELTACIQQFNNSNILDQYYTNARKTYLEKYHPDIHYNSIMDIYKEVTGTYK